MNSERSALDKSKCATTIGASVRCNSRNTSCTAFQSAKVDENKIDLTNKYKSKK